MQSISDNAHPIAHESAMMCVATPQVLSTTYNTYTPVQRQKNELAEIQHWISGWLSK